MFHLSLVGVCYGVDIISVEIISVEWDEFNLGTIHMILPTKQYKKNT